MNDEPIIIGKSLTDLDPVIIGEAGFYGVHGVDHAAIDQAVVDKVNPEPAIKPVEPTSEDRAHLRAAKFVLIGVLKSGGQRVTGSRTWRRNAYGMRLTVTFAVKDGKPRWNLTATVSKREHRSDFDALDPLLGVVSGLVRTAYGAALAAARKQPP